MKLRIYLKNLVRSTPILLVSVAGFAFDVDWSGQFWAENNFVHNYELGNGAYSDPARKGQGGYYIPGGGSGNAHWQSLFLRVKPKMIVNDNITIKSEWWVGDPVYGAMGNAAPYANEQRQYYSTQSRGSLITAQRYWAEFLSDLGTFQVGRQPLQWGLGLVWNSGDKEFSRYSSTGDAIRVVSRFGNFLLAPAVVKYSVGNNFGGACQWGPDPTSSSTASVCNPAVGGGGVADYSLQFLYENKDEEFKAGVNFIKRIAGAAQDPSSGYLGVGSVTSAAQPAVGMNYNIWDIYFRKKLGKFTFETELPVVSGQVGSINDSTYKTIAAAFDVKWAISDAWESNFLLGSAPGQPNIDTANPNRIKTFYFHPNYKVGLIMFNYNLSGFAGPNTQNDSTIDSASLKSPYDNPMNNAKYLSWNGALKTEKWRFHTTFTYAQANEAAGPNSNFYNGWDRRYHVNTTGKTQSKSLGWEMDYGTEFKWDEVFKFGFDFGWFFPGQFFAFSNTAVDNNRAAVLAIIAKASVNF